MPRPGPENIQAAENAIPLPLCIPKAEARGHRFQYMGQSGQATDGTHGRLSHEDEAWEPPTQTGEMTGVGWRPSRVLTETDPGMDAMHIMGLGPWCIGRWQLLLAMARTQ